MENLGCLIKGHTVMYSCWNPYRNRHTGVCLYCGKWFEQLLMSATWIEDVKEVANGK